MAKKIVLNTRSLAIRVCILVIITVALIVSCFYSSQIESMLKIGSASKSGNFVSSEVVSDCGLKIHYINVEQADCTFIELPDGTSMLIDAGEKKTDDDVVSYIKALGYSTINYFVVTHSDSDHSGGAVSIFEAFEIQEVYRPFQIAGDYNSDSENIDTFIVSEYEDLADIYQTLKSDEIFDDFVNEIDRIDTATYRNTVKAMYDETYTKAGKTEDTKVIVSHDGIIIESTNINYEFEIEFFAPVLYKTPTNQTIDVSAVSDETEGYVTTAYTDDNFNDVCTLIKIEYLNNKFVFTGDMTTEAEEDVLNNLSASDREELSNITVYQAGHHGASNSNTQELLNLLNPTYTVVSCGLDNSYGHPTKEFLERLNSLDHKVTDYLLRTDLQGNIAFGVKVDGSVVYAANIEIENEVFAIEWWHIAVTIFVISTVLVFGIKIKKSTLNKFKKTKK